MDSYAVDEKRPVPQTENLEGWVSRLMLVSITYILMGIGCFVCGIMTFVYGADGHLEWPYTSGSGLWAGIYLICMGLYGVSIMRKFDKDDLSKTSRHMHGFSTVIAVGISVMMQHTTYFGMGLGSCVAEQDKCVEKWRSEQLLVQAFGLAFGIVAVILILGSLVFFHCKHRLYKLSGRQPRCCC